MRCAIPGSCPRSGNGSQPHSDGSSPGLAAGESRRAMPKPGISRRRLALLRIPGRSRRHQPAEYAYSSQRSDVAAFAELFPGSELVAEPVFQHRLATAPRGPAAIAPDVHHRFCAIPDFPRLRAAASVSHAERATTGSGPRSRRTRPASWSGLASTDGFEREPGPFGPGRQFDFVWAASLFSLPGICSRMADAIDIILEPQACCVSAPATSVICHRRFRCRKMDSISVQ